MTVIERLRPKAVAEPAAHYSVAARADGRIYVSGLVSLSEQGQLVGGTSAGEQTLHICRTLESICRQYGGKLANVAQCTVILTDLKNYADVDAAFAEAFGEHKPARATFVAQLVRPEFLVEIMTIVEGCPSTSSEDSSV
jgi:enamine deaminase RidA (YjgF/YER057c/UK114 family)